MSKKWKYQHCLESLGQSQERNVWKNRDAKDSGANVVHKQTYYCILDSNKILDIWDPIFDIRYGMVLSFFFFGIHTGRHSTVAADEKYKAPGAFSGGCEEFVCMSKNLLKIRVSYVCWSRRWALTCSKGIVLRSFQRIICSLHTHELEMKISTLLDDHKKRGICMEGKRCREFRCDRHI